VFKKLQVPDYILEQIVTSLQKSHEGKADFRETQYKQLTEEHEVYTKRLEKIYIDRLDGRITDNEYDKFYQSFRDKVAEIDTRLAMLQEADDNYYITARYLLELANRAYELFKSSEVEERRQLIKLVLSNLRVEDKLVRYDAIKPFDTILNYADGQVWLLD